MNTKLKILSGIILCITSSSVYADTSTTTTSTTTTPITTAPTTTAPTATAPTTSTPSPTTTNTQPFKLVAKKVEISLDQLKDVGFDLKHVLSICGHLYDEVTNCPETVITEPEMIGAGTVINLPVALEPTGPPRPPRKERVDLLMSEIRPVITLLAQNGDEFLKDSQVAGFPEPMQEKLNPLIKKWVAYADDVYAKLLKLEALTPGPAYDNYAIADAIKAIQSDVQQIDEVRRPIYKLVQEEGKRLMAAQNNEQ